MTAKNETFKKFASNLSKGDIVFISYDSKAKVTEYFHPVKSLFITIHNTPDLTFFALRRHEGLKTLKQLFCFKSCDALLTDVNFSLASHTSLNTDYDAELI